MIESRARRGARPRTTVEARARVPRRRSLPPRPLGVVAALVLALAAHPLLIGAQHSGQVTATGVPIPGATITATQGDKEVVTSTDPEGRYTIPELDAGAWTIRVEMPGFAPLARDVTVAGAAEAATWELTLLPFEEITRGVVVPVPVEPGADPPAQATAARDRPAASPSGTSSAFQRAAVSASAPPPAGAAPAGEPPVDPVFGAADGFLINGSVNNGAATPFAQSGAFGNNRRILSRRPYSYTFGLNARRSAWDASPSTFGGRLETLPDYNNLNVSGTFGGPIRIPGLLRNGPSFTLSYQRSTDQTARTSSALMPTALERGGDFSQTRDAFGDAVTIVDPATGLPFPDNVIPADRISPQAAALLGYYPSPNLDGSRLFNYQRALPSTTVRDSASFNTSYSLTSRNQITGTVQYQRSKAGTSSLFGFDDETRGSGVDVTLGLTHRVSPFLTFRFRNTFSRQTSTTIPFFANRTNVSGEAGITGNDQDPLNWGPPALTLSSVASLTAGEYSSSRTLANTSAAEGFLSRGRHSFTMGGEVRRNHLDLLAQQNPRGSFFFGGGATGSDFGDFLLGMPQTSRIAFGNADKYFRGFSYAAYLVDDYRVGPSLTVNLGVRWEYEAPFTELQGRLVNLDVAPGFTAVSPVIASDPAGSLTGRRYPDSLVRPDKRGVQPRVSLAWRPILGSSVIVRAGYGIYRNNGLYQSLARALSQQSPLSHVVNAERSAETPLTLADGFIPSPGITANTYAIDPDFRVSSGHVWQASVQRDLPISLTLVGTYVGTKGVHLVQQFLPNTFAPGGVNPCPSCPIGFAYVTSTGSSLRNSGQLQVRRRLRGGLTASAQYTLAKGTDNAATFSGTAGTSAQDWLDLGAEHGPSGDDQRHQFGAQVQYTTGVGPAGGAFLSGLTGALVKGWTLAGQLVIGSGRPLTPVYSTALPGAAINGTVRAALTGAAVDEVPDGYYLNPLAYTIPAAGEWGSAGRHSVRGPRQFSLDAALTRSFPVTGRLNIDWRIGATNLLNRVTYNSVSTILNSPQFGLATSTNDMRKIQTSMRVRF